VAWLSSAKFPLRLADKLLLVAGAWVVGVALIFFAAVPTVRDQVVTETRMTSWLTTETGSTTWFTTETRTTSATITTISSVTRVGTTTTYVPIVVWGVTTYSAKTVIYTYVVETTAIWTSLIKVTETRTKTTYSAETITERSWIQITTTSRVVEPPYLQTVLWIGVGIILFGLTYHRVNAYRTRLHIYYDILRYVSASPRIASHIMRRCNLETGKFNKYVNELQAKGFVNMVQRGDVKEYVATEKSLEYLRDEKLAKFIAELS